MNDNTCNKWPNRRMVKFPFKFLNRTNKCHKAATNKQQTTGKSKFPGDVDKAVTTDEQHKEDGIISDIIIIVI